MRPEAVVVTTTCYLELLPADEQYPRPPSFRPVAPLLGLPTRRGPPLRRAAELGNHEFQVITFPANYCNDSGRRINNNEQDWPDSLEGFAKRAYVYCE